MCYFERQAACKARAFYAGEEVVEEVGCDSSSAGDGSLVMFKCDLIGKNLSFTGKNWHVPFVGVCLNTSAERYEEHCDYESKCVTYRKGKCLDSELVWTCDRAYHPVSNSSDLPPHGDNHVDVAQVGSFVVPWEGYLEGMECNTPVMAERKPGNFQEFDGSYYDGTDSSDVVDKHRVRFRGTDMTESTLTVLGQNNGGKIEPWKSPSSWFCPSFALAGLKQGEAEKEDFFQSFADENDNQAMLFRAVAFLTFYLGLGCCSGCRKGKCFSVFIVPIVPACGCALFFFGVARVAVQPWPLDIIGISAVGASLCILGLTAWCRFRNRKDDSERQEMCQV